MTSIFIKGEKKNRYKVEGCIDSNLTKKEVEDTLEMLGFYMFKIEEVK